MSYFTQEEFKCKCGKCPVKEVDPALLSRLNSLRAAYGKPLYVVSGIRCVEYNKKVGGVIDSAHMSGQAADLFCNMSYDRYQLMFHTIGLFNRIGIGTSFIHVDVDLTKPQEVMWLYGAH